MANPALMVLPLDGSLQGRDRSGVFSAVGAGAVRYRPAGDARRNVCANPDFRVDTVRWSGASASIARVADAGVASGAVLRVTQTAYGGGGLYNPASMAPWPLLSIGLPVEISAGFRVVSGGAVQPRVTVFEYDASGFTLASHSVVTLPSVSEGEWRRIAVTATVTHRETHGIAVLFGANGSDRVFDLADVVIEPEGVVDSRMESLVFIHPLLGYGMTAGNGFSASRVMAWLEDGRTNLVTNPWRSSNNTGWSAVNGSTSRSTWYGYARAACGLLTASAANAEERISITAPASGHVAHALVRNLHTANRQCQLTYNGSSIGAPVTVASGETASVVAAFTGTGAAANLGVRWLDSANGNLFATYYLGAFAGSIADSPVPVIDAGGTIQGGYAWTGTAHASTSTRTAATITLDEAGRIDPVSGSLAFRFVRDIDTGAAEPILDVGEGTTGKDRLRVRVNSSDKLEVSWQSNGASETTLASTESIVVGQEYLIYVGWQGTSVEVSIDNGVMATGTRDAPRGNWGTTDLVLEAA